MPIAKNTVLCTVLKICKEGRSSCCVIPQNKFFLNKEGDRKLLDGYIYGTVFHEHKLISKFVKLHTLNMYRLLDVNHTSLKCFYKNKVYKVIIN